MSNGLIDMHMHTNYSDGDLSPNELIEKAIDNKIETMAEQVYQVFDTINTIVLYVIGVPFFLQMIYMLLLNYLLGF